MNDIVKFAQETLQRIQKQAEDKKIILSARSFMKEASILQYSYNFTWLGLPIIQFPQDIVALQEIIWQVKPD
ncbi:MAG: cephalosporin hydroxylase family protein, partial [Candidatus Calescibacterium sp.]|nr:cephalosporin hydroxylase family protein [Candidatus Calescibacterium sp.]